MMRARPALCPKLEGHIHWQIPPSCISLLLFDVRTQKLYACSLLNLALQILQPLRSSPRRQHAPDYGTEPISDYRNPHKHTISLIANCVFWESFSDNGVVAVIIHSENMIPRFVFGLNTMALDSTCFQHGRWDRWEPKAPTWSRKMFHKGNDFARCGTSNLCKQTNSVIWK